MFAVLDIESSTKEDVKDREIFIKVLESVTKHIKHDILKERLEYDTLERVKLISNSKQFNTKLVLSSNHSSRFSNKSMVSFSFSAIFIKYDVHHHVSRNPDFGNVANGP